MKKTHIGESACIFALLLSTLVSGGEKGRTPVTDDVATLDILKGNIPQDYRIPVDHTPKAVSGKCWLQLNLYPVEKSLKQLAHQFSNLSINRENITMFITMLQGLRFMLGNEELLKKRTLKCLFEGNNCVSLRLKNIRPPQDVAMQAYECHYRTAHWPTDRYFEHVKEVLGAASSVSGMVDCAPPPCATTEPPPAVTLGNELQYRYGERVNMNLPVLLLSPVLFIISLATWMVLRRTGVCVCVKRGSRDEPTGAESPPEPQGTEAQCGAAPGSPLQLSLMSLERSTQSIVIVDVPDDSEV
ncbi:kit ligand b isoform X1 [Engraulis encrasicolus]|uniref:kit ligand b isoform X1 n=1 Tax=Engraulis encrasicolus TaxID=184585 RepID=UPI002FD437DE